MPISVRKENIDFSLFKDVTFPLGINEQYDPSEEERKIHEQLVNSAWCGLLAALTILLEACTDEAATENILKAIQVDYIYRKSINTLAES